MSLRRFVYLVTNDAVHCHRQFLLRRIDMSSFFFPKRGRFADPLPWEEGRLPSPAVKFTPPLSNDFSKGDMHFMLIPGGDCGDGVVSTRRTRDKVVATDQTGRNLMYDSEHHTIRTLCSLTTPKVARPISLTVRNNLYILDGVLKGNRDHCFDVIMHDDPNSISDVDDWLRSVTNIREKWYCEPLPPPPYAHTHDNCMDGDPAHVTSYAVVGDSNIWISKENLGTHSFDTVSRVWTKVGDWVLPFYGRVHYVPEHKLWFGLSCGYGEDAYMFSSDLTVTPPMACNVWGKPAELEWTNKWHYLVHLGRSRFCYARFYEITRPDLDHRLNKFVELTGLEVQRSGEDGSKFVVVVQHRSERYKLDNGMMQCVL